MYQCVPSLAKRLHSNAIGGLQTFAPNRVSAPIPWLPNTTRSSFLPSSLPGIISRGRVLTHVIRGFVTANPLNILQDMDPKHHSGGRWLHQDKLQREARNIQFDFQSLCERAIALCPGEDKIESCQKIEGGFNRSFLFTLDGGSKVVARLPTSVAGPPRLTIASEVATMAYLKRHTSIPIPKVLEWNSDPSNPVGAEYIIMEFVEGVRLSERWDSMDSLQRLECTNTLTMMIKDMAGLDYPAYGSLYFKDAPLKDGVKIPYGDEYCIGHHCAPTYWKRGAAELELYGSDIPDPGPWRDLQSFCEGLIATGLSRLPKSDRKRRAEYQGTIEEHVQLLKAAQTVMSQLVQNMALKDAATPILLHPDFHKRNIFVSELDPTVVTGIIDWQGASIQPAFMHATETPDFASLPDDLPFLKKLGERAEENEHELKAASICAQAFDVIIKAHAPKLQRGRDLDPSLTRIFRYCLTSWTSSATSIREELIDLSQRWKQLGLGGYCGYSVSEEELARHKKLYTDLEDAMKLKEGIMRVLCANPDGYVSNDEWERARDALPLLMEQWVASATESGTDDADARAMFPFDGC